MLKKVLPELPNTGVIRVITNSDTYCECDDQYCIAHLLMTPYFDNCAMISTHYNKNPEEMSEEKSFDELKHIVKLMHLENEVNLLHGSSVPLPDEMTPVDSEGARFIVEEALRKDERPLFVCGIGALTNIASAYLMNPAIAERMTVLWIGGQPYPQGGFEFNACNDINAVNVIMKSKIKLWQIPADVYSKMHISFFELIEKVYHCGEIGKYLVENTMRVEKVFQMIKKSVAGMETGLTSSDPAISATLFGGEQWILGDSPVVGLMLNNTIGKYEMCMAPFEVRADGTYNMSCPGSREIRVYRDIDHRFILNDFFAKINYYFKEN